MGEARLIFSDGACIGNPGPGAYASLILDARGGEQVIVGRGTAMTTNNVMELTAAITALEKIAAGSTVTLHSDSQYVIRGITEWLPQWKARGWRKADRKPVLNRELWERIEALAAEHNVTWKWVRGHAGDVLNERVDRLAEDEALKFAAEIGWTPGARFGFTPATGR
jgi:ribonuclease HI